MQHLSLSGSAGVSDIYIGKGLLAQAAEYCCKKFDPSRVHIVTDSNVAPLYLDVVRRQFQVPLSVTIIPAGEDHKRLSTVEILYHDFLKSKVTRKDLVLALGGGVTGDLAGFAASTFLRGISLCQIPTTLLAQVDSSVGGKTGVDLPEGKNLVGAFYQPGLVLIDPEVLDTLPPAVFNDGMAEVIKYGCIRNQDILEMVKKPQASIDIENVIQQCVKIKRDIVELDERDTGLRMILNFGHTIGHAAEKLANYKDLTHGQAVSIGMVAAMRLAGCIDESSSDLIDDLTALLQSYDLPITLPYSHDAIFEALLSDKKKFADTVNFIIVPKFGQAKIVPMSTSLLKKYLTTL